MKPIQEAIEFVTEYFWHLVGVLLCVVMVVGFIWITSEGASERARKVDLAECFEFAWALPDAGNERDAALDLCAKRGGIDP